MVPNMKQEKDSLFPVFHVKFNYFKEIKAQRCYKYHKSPLPQEGMPRPLQDVRKWIVQ